MSTDEKMMRVFGRMEVCLMDLNDLKVEMEDSPLRHRELLQSVVNRMSDALRCADTAKNEIYS